MRQLFRSSFQFDLVVEMPFRVDLREVFPKPALGCLHGQERQVEFFNRCGSVADDEPHWLNDPPSPKVSFRLPCDQQALIAVMVQNPAKML